VSTQLPGLLSGHSSPAPEFFRAEWEGFLEHTTIGDVWIRAGLEPRVRALITVSALAAQRAESELRVELPAALDLGVAGVELCESMVQVAAYAGLASGRMGLSLLSELLGGDGPATSAEQSTRHGGDRITRGRAVLAEIRPDLAAGPPAGMKPPLPFALPWNGWLMQAAFGDLWNRPHLSLVDREWVTLGALVALGHEFELDAHFRTTHYLGMAPEEVREAIIHLAAYVGFSSGGRAIRLAAEVFNELNAQRKDV
jgi:4-carboxymuconolactone decarboxylase